MAHHFYLLFKISLFKSGHILPLYSILPLKPLNLGKRLGSLALISLLVPNFPYLFTQTSVFTLAFGPRH